MNVIFEIESIEHRAMEAGLSVDQLYTEAKVAFSNRSRWFNKKTSPNTSTLSRFERVIQKHIKKNGRKK